MGEFPSYLDLSQLGIIPSRFFNHPRIMRKPILSNRLLDSLRDKAPPLLGDFNYKEKRSEDQRKPQTSNLNKQKVVESSKEAQALQVVARTPLAPAGLTMAGSSKLTKPLADPPHNNTSCGTSLRRFLETM
ncbi:UNVERIFIED_CONTAM: hypothetical protein Sindi_2696600 [Sesamum indicum]